MLTQGYRRFEWRQILSNDTFPVKYQPEASLEISGKLTTLGGRKPIPHGRVSLLSSSQGFVMLDTVADDQGRFAFKNLQFRDSSKFVLQSKKNKDSKNLRIEMDSIPAAPVTAGIIRSSSDPDSSFAVYMDNSKLVYDKQIKYGMRNRVKTLKEVQIKDKKAVINSANLNGPGNADQVFLMKDIHGGCPTLADCLIGRLASVFFQWDIYGVAHPCAYVDGKPSTVKVMLDGIKIDDDTFDTLPPDIVESVEVLKGMEYRSVYGFEGSTPLLLINTKRGSYAAITSPNIVTYMPKGYYKAREFYSPKYDTPPNKPLEDLRTTIYWNPNVATDKDGNASLEYFNADVKGSYRIVIEGIDENGNLGRQVYSYKADAMNAQ